MADFQWGMLQETVIKWFGDFTTNKEIRIGDLVTVPYVVELSRPSAAHYIGEAGLVPRFTGATNADESYVGSKTSGRQHSPPRKHGYACSRTWIPAVTRYPVSFVRSRA